MATPSYRERMKATRAAASAQRKAEKAEWLRQVELRVEVKRLAREAVIYSIRAAGDKVQSWSQAEIEIEARRLVCPWLIAKARERIAERNSKHLSNPKVPANRGLPLNETNAQNAGPR
jgi:hypothetical protein